MNQYEIVRSIYNKIVTKCPIGTCRAKFTKQPNSPFPLRCQCEAGLTLCHDPNNTRGFRLVSKNYSTAIMTTIVVNTRFLNFNTAQERDNAWASFLTKFCRFCVSLDESSKVVPFMNNYMEPWTDERFKQYFELTDIEWQLIDTVIKD